MSCRDLNKDVDHILVTEEEISAVVTHLAAQIDNDQKDRSSDLLL